MFQAVKPVLLPIAIYYFLSFVALNIHKSFDPSIVYTRDMWPLIIAGSYNVVFFVVAGYIASYLENKDGNQAAVFCGLILVVLNFGGFIVSEEVQPFAIRILKVVLPLHACILGSKLFKRLADFN